MKEELKPVDLGHLESKAICIVDCFNKANDTDRSKEYRAFHLERAEQVSKSLVSDFGFIFDKYKIGGIVPFGLNDN